MRYNTDAIILRIQNLNEEIDNLKGSTEDNSEKQKEEKIGLLKEQLGFLDNAVAIGQTDLKNSEWILDVMETHAPNVTYPNIEQTLRVEIGNRNIQKFREANKGNRERDAQEQKEIGKITQPLYDLIDGVNNDEFKKSKEATTSY